MLLSEQQASLLHCRHDSSLLSAWHQKHNSSSGATTAAAAAAAAVVTHPKRYLLAANFHNSAAILPNFLLQVLRLALLLPQASLAVSVYESGSSDTSRQWLTLLHHLLLPLGVSHNITLGGQLSPRQGLQRIQLLAALRNAAIEPWLPQQQQQLPSLPLLPPQQQQQQSSLGHRKAGTSAAGSVELSYRASDSWSPDVIFYVNDVLLCVEDVMRLVLHDAHIACGMDFYDAAWMDAPAAAAAAAVDARTAEAGVAEAAAAAGGGAVGDATAGSGGSKGGGGDSSSSSSSSGLLSGPQADDDFFDPLTGRLRPGKDSSNSSSIGGLRFYDKVRLGFSQADRLCPANADRSRF